MEDKQSPILPIAFAAFLAVIVACYVVAYFQLGNVSALGPGIVRVYPNKLLTEVFTLPAIVESWIRRHPVYLGHP